MRRPALSRLTVLVWGLVAMLPHARLQASQIHWKMDERMARRLAAEAVQHRFNAAEMRKYVKLRRLKPFFIYEDTPDTRGSPAGGLGIIRDIRAKLDRDREPRR